jgi:hypothetical protein
LSSFFFDIVKKTLKTVSLYVAWYVIKLRIKMLFLGLGPSQTLPLKEKGLKKEKSV